MIINGWFALGLVAAAGVAWLVVGWLRNGRLPDTEHGITEAQLTREAGLLADPAVRKSIERHRRKLARAGAR